eukprot:6490302-Amphidinium_carterae.3
MAGTAKAKSLLKTTSEKSNGAVTLRQPSKKSTPSIHDQVRKAITQNFKGWSTAQLTTHYVEGLNLKETIKRDKERHMREGDKFPMGRDYYSALKRLFAGQKDLRHQLKVSEGSKADAELVDSVCKSQNHPPNDIPLLFWLGSRKSMTQAEYVGLCRYCLDLSPSVSVRQLRLTKEMLRCFARTKIHERDADTTKLMRQKFSDILTEAVNRTTRETRKIRSLRNQFEVLLSW